MGEELTVRLWRLLNDASERCALNSNELCLLDEARVEILRLQESERKLWRLEWEAEHGPLGILCGGEDNG